MWVFKGTANLTVVCKRYAWAHTLKCFFNLLYEEWLFKDELTANKEKTVRYDTGYIVEIVLGLLTVNVRDECSR